MSVDVDADAFFRDVQALRAELLGELGEEDTDHLRRFERIGRIATAVGLATAPWFPNPVSAVALSLGRSTSWILMHHIGHKGYDKVPNIPRRFTSKVFARGKRRMLDWPDWMTPAAWCHEHNNLHHTYTGEDTDPDNVERNTEYLRDPKYSMPARYAMVGALLATWRFTYYAPQTTELLLERQLKRPPTKQEFRKAYWKDNILPYTLVQFVGLPALFAPFGPWASFSALCNSLMAEVLTNAHTFLVVGPNHTGDDVMRFDTPAKNRAEAMLRQVLGSVNYRTGGDMVDFFHLFLNYQIEHHLYPDLPMRTYQKAQPKVEALCKKHGVPYIQESVFRRFGKLVDVIVGKTQMKRAEPVRNDWRDELSDAQAAE